ncbi:MAG: hypothetical protein WC088_06245 [Candidatus Izemoplasmatales bacterium]|jgi:hypothetical protein
MENKTEKQRQDVIKAVKNIACKCSGTTDFGMTSKLHLACTVAKLNDVINVLSAYINKMDKCIDNYGQSKIIAELIRLRKEFNYNQE